MTTQVDQRRLRDGEIALSQPIPKTLEEARQQIGFLHDGIAAVQSLDDDPVINIYASKLNDALLRRLKALERILAHLEGALCGCPQCVTIAALEWEPALTARDPDPTTAAVVAQIEERDQLRAENRRLVSALASARDQTIREIHDYFAKAKQADVVAEIEKIWLAEKPS